MKTERLLYWVAIIALIVFAYNQCGKTKSAEQLALALTDTMHVTRNELGQQVASKLVLVGEVNTLKQMHFKDSVAIDLQSRINKNTLSATAFKTQTTNEHTTATRVESDSSDNRNGESGIIGSDSTCHEESPVYSTDFTGPWERYHIRASRDSIQLQHVSYNQFAVTQEWKKQKGLKGIFHPPVLEVSIVNENPNTETVGVSSFHADIPKQNKLLWFLGGVLITSVGIAAIQ